MDKPTLPPRGNRAIYFGIFLFFISMLVSFIYLEVEENYHVSIYLLSMSSLAMILGELLRRLCLFVEEHRHRRERYGDNWKMVFEKVFSFHKNNWQNNMTVLFMFVAFVSLAYSYYPSSNAVFKGGKYFMLLFQNIAIVPMVGYLSGLRAPTAVEISEMHEKYNKNLADGLAWSYYFGYLKLVLPELEGARVETKEVRELLQSPVKLYIIIPMNCYCPKELDDKNIEVYCNLKPIEKSRGGVANRRYHQTVHKITIPKGKDQSDEKYVGEHYCLAEYATPLLTLYDMSKDKNAALSKEERLNQVKLFRDKLKAILDTDLDCKGKYELIELHEKYDNFALEIVKRMKNAPIDVHE